MSRGRGWASEEGSAVAEFVMVSGLLTLLTLSVMQLGLVLFIRNTVVDAAAEGARFAALADNSADDGVARAVDLISTALGPGYAKDVTASSGSYLGFPAMTITVHAPLPLIGLIGLDGGLEVSGHAAIETLG
ncbi:TadE/TadG family type IV pilus assembly protein [Salinibacterium sp. G-O1]|uniref:TadE/TadG family type IV pilus assembly protein n=1 Tax=Salinibacterium sp. G-O1 TaxID=3046208 RepID=UPI0024B8AE57|nr:TadE/TadG family type IV pilus assembly protein [Salinibacterium sp. G-O1]MDJ0334577.1 TadE/TadG family type IV pilus assembly protein [Salinibacterium sp. G-O1]